MKTLTCRPQFCPYKNSLLSRIWSVFCQPGASSSTCLAEESPAKWKTVVGLEIHAQISAQSKLFSRTGTDFRAAINSKVALHDAAIPGTLPVLNKKCVEAAVLTSLALKCKLNPVSMFDRKHYFYPDMPAGYQITQQRLPIAYDGVITYPVLAVGGTPYMKTSRIKQIQLEQDSGRTLMDENSGRKLVDLNRAGIALMELVFEPDLEDGEEAAALVKELSVIFELLGTCDCKMEEGNLRVDANISVHRDGEPLGVRTEVKNIGSVRAIANAVTWEAKRQVKVLEAGNKVINETRTWDREKACTASMREKESKQDYRYMPEPNLPPLRLQMNEDEPQDPHRVNVLELERRLPELPQETRALLDPYQLNPWTIAQLLDNRNFLEIFLDTMKKDPSRKGQRVASMLVNHLMAALHSKNIPVEKSNITASALGEIEDMISGNVIKANACDFILAEIVAGNKATPNEIVAKLDLYVITDPEKMDAVCQSVFEKNPELVSRKSPKDIMLLAGKVSEEIKKAASIEFILERVSKNLGFQEPVDVSQVKTKKKKRKNKPVVRE